jgi:hypothetical protein
MEIVPYSRAHRDAVERLNAKLSSAGSEWQFPEVERPLDVDEVPVWLESFVVAEGGDVYGGYVLKHQEFLIQGRSLELGDLQIPLSLGEIDTTKAQVSAALIFDVRRRAPCAYSLGLGSTQSQFAKLLTAAGWRHLVVPFYFNVKSANQFARNIRLPADSHALEKILRVLGRVRLAGAALRLQQLLAQRGKPRAALGASNHVREVARFDALADELFAKHSKAYTLVGDRTARALNCVYPQSEDKYIRVVVEKGGAAIGWALLLDKKMESDKYFGDMRVGLLADCFADPQDAAAVVSSVDRYLTERGVDLAISNQLHPGWCRALELAGYQRGPSNFFFYFSDDLHRQLTALPGWDQGIHLNRGDGEGPTHF